MTSEAERRFFAADLHAVNQASGASANECPHAAPRRGIAQISTQSVEYLGWQAVEKLWHAALQPIWASRQGVEAGQSPQRACPAETTQPMAKSGATPWALGISAFGGPAAAGSQPVCRGMLLARALPYAQVPDRAAIASFSTPC
jgi:hypothetical protein